MQLLESMTRWLVHFPGTRRRRSCPRAIVDEPAPLHALARGTNALVLLRNISVGGACVRTHLALAIGDGVQMNVGPADGEHFEISAAVIWTRPDLATGFYDYGLRMTQLTLEGARALRRYIERRLSPDEQPDRPA